MLIEQRVGTPVDAFTYPNGIYYRRAVRLVQGAGFGLAFSGRFGSQMPSDDMFQAKGVSVHEGDSLLDFVGKLDGAYDWVPFFQGGWNRVKGWV